MILESSTLHQRGHRVLNCELVRALQNVAPSNPTRPTHPTPTQPTPTQPNPTQPNPTQPNPTQPNPTQPNPTQPNPTLAMFAHRSHLPCYDVAIFCLILRTAIFLFGNSGLNVMGPPPDEDAAAGGGGGGGGDPHVQEIFRRAEAG